MQNPFCSRRSHADKPGKDIVDPLTTSAVRLEGLAKSVPSVAPGIHQSQGEYVQAHGCRSESPHSGAIHAPYTIGCFNVTVDVDRLVHVHRAIRTPTQCVEYVVGVLRAESRQDDPLDIGSAVAIGIT